MKLKDQLKTINDDEIIYFGLSSGAGFPFIERKKDLDFDVMNTLVEKFFEVMRLSAADEYRRALNKEDIDADIFAKVKERHEKLQSIDFERLEDREVVDCFFRYAEPDYLGTAVIVEGVECLKGHWLYKEVHK